MDEPDVSGPLLWSKFQKEGLIVDAELQHILKVSKFDNLSVLAKFTDEDETRMVAFMRNTFFKLIKHEDREKFYGCFHESPELFEFVGGQRKTLLLIQQMAKRFLLLNKQRGISSLLNDSQPTSVPSQSSKTTSKNGGHVVNEQTADKVYEYAKKLEEGLNSHLADNFEGNYKAEVTVAKDGLGYFVAESSCPMCTKKIRISRNHTRWNVSNYYTHLRTHIKKQGSNEEKLPTLDPFLIKSSTSKSTVKRHLIPKVACGKRPKRSLAVMSRRPLDQSEEEEEDDVEVMEVGPDAEKESNSGDKSQTENEEDNDVAQGDKEEDKDVGSTSGNETEIFF